MICSQCCSTSLDGMPFPLLMKKYPCYQEITPLSCKNFFEYQDPSSTSDNSSAGYIICLRDSHSKKRWSELEYSCKKDEHAHRKRECCQSITCYARHRLKRSDDQITDLHLFDRCFEILLKTMRARPIEQNLDDIRLPF